MDIENYFLDVATHEEALRAAGFSDIRWHRPLLSPEGDAAYGREYWSDLLDHPPVILSSVSSDLLKRVRRVSP